MRDCILNFRPTGNNCINGGFICDNSSRSFPATIASSAAGLLRDTLSSNSNQVGAALSLALHESGKAGSSSSVAASAPSSTHQPTPRPELPVATGGSSENDTFRSSIRPPNAPRETFEGMTLDQFLQSSVESQGHLFEEDEQLDKGKRAIYTTDNRDTIRHSQDIDSAFAWKSGNVEKDSQLRETNSLNDGDEVVKLLSDPNFQPDIWTDTYPEEPSTITEEELQISQWFTKKTQEGEPQREQLQNAVAAARGGRAFEDFETIFDEIEHYHEDVWGYIGPLVEAARQERRVTEPTNTGDGPAVQRLRMIVAHLQPPAVQTSINPLYRG